LGDACRLDVARSAAEALAILHERPCDVAMVDEGLLAAEGPDLVRRIRDANGSLVVVTLGRADETRKRGPIAGVFERLPEGAAPDAKVAAVERAARHADLAREVRRLRQEVSRAGECARGRAAERADSVCSLHALLERVASSDANALIVGARGTGKGALARAIHRLGSRRDGPFVAIDCAAEHRPSLAVKLFGHERGACATAGPAQRGLFRAAHGGTVYLGSVSEVDASLQESLYRALSERAVVPVGGDRAVGVDVRVIASTNEDPKAMVADGRLREDLYWALALLPVEVPSLNERLQDLPRLAAGILGARDCAVGAALAPPLTRQLGISEAALARLADHDWPGNARELVSVLQLAATLCDGDTIRRRDLEAAGFRAMRVSVSPGSRADGAHTGGERDDRPIADAAAGRPLKAVVEECVREVERRAILEALERADGSVARAADLLGISRAAIYYKIRDYRIRF